MSDTTQDPPNGSDVLLLMLRLNAANALEISFQDADYINHTQFVIDSAPLDSGSHNQIAFRLSKNDADKKTITASYAYIDGPFANNWSSLSWITFSNTMDIFDSDNFTQVFGHQNGTRPRTRHHVPSWFWLGRACGFQEEVQKELICFSWGYQRQGRHPNPAFLS